MTIDEFYFHEKRGLGKWERWGHPMDTLTVITPTFYLFVTSPETVSQNLFVSMAVFSSVFVTKDEWVHKEKSPPQEQWLHAILFVLHPTMFWAIWQMHQNVQPEWIAGFLVLQILFFFYQVVRWNFLKKTK